MLTAEGCRSRRQRLYAALPEKPPEGYLLLSDPLNLRYLANVYIEPFSYAADFDGILKIDEDGTATLFTDGRLPPSAAKACVDDTQASKWYDGNTAGRGSRSYFPARFVADNGGRLHDSLTDPIAESVQATIARMRRQKDPDEVALLKSCMVAGAVGQDWARHNLKAGMTELAVYCGIFHAIAEHLGHWAMVYGDFAVSPGTSRKGGPPTSKVVADGDMMIIDYSVILSGYRSDYTNTLVVGGKPNAEQVRLFDACVAAMKAGEVKLRAGTTCQSVYDAVMGAFVERDLGSAFPHHAGHGLGISHPEAPFLVRQSSETLLAGDVVTLEPGAYVDGIGGIRIEHNYLITADGYETLSHHTIALV